MIGYATITRGKEGKHFLRLAWAENNSRVKECKAAEEVVLEKE